MIKAVVFDWDGTLADTLPLHLESFREVLKGRQIAPVDLYKREGRKSEEIIADMAREFSPQEAEELARKKNEIYRRLSGGVKRYPGAMELVERLKGSGLKVGLVTGTKRGSLHAVMSQEEIGLFDHITTADDIEKSKPDPEPYMRCLDDIGIMPRESIAVENAPLGIQSAKAAGMTCIAISSTLPPEFLKGADFIAGSITEAGEIINRLLEKQER